METLPTLEKSSTKKASSMRSLSTAPYLAAIVRYSGGNDPATIRTVYFPYEVRGSLGRLLHVDP